MSEDVNDALDVVVVVLAGSGRLVVDGVGLPLTTAVVPTYRKVRPEPSTRMTPAWPI
jgi:hypothetical protein